MSEPTNPASPTPAPAGVVHIQSHYEGPLPPPQAMEGYERLAPGAAAELIKDFVAEGAHRRDCEKFDLHETARGNRALERLVLIGVVSFQIFGLCSLAALIALAFTSEGALKYVAAVLAGLAALLTAAAQLVRAFGKKG